MKGKAVVSLTTGLEDPEKVTVAFLVAVGAAEQGHPTLMFLTKEAVRPSCRPPAAWRYGAYVFSLTKPSPDSLSRLVAQQSDRELTYPEHGATAGDMPPGYHHDEWAAELGPFCQATFDRLADMLRRWHVQTGSGLAVFPAEPVRSGLTFALWFRLPGAYATAAGRVVYVTSEPDRAGFAYGTLPAHPERGEEAFHVVREGDRLVFRVRAFSKPRHALARLGAPVSRALQLRMSQAYLKTMREAAAVTTG